MRNLHILHQLQVPEQVHDSFAHRPCTWTVRNASTLSAVAKTGCDYQ